MVLLKISRFYGDLKLEKMLVRGYTSVELINHGKSGTSKYCDVTGVTRLKSVHAVRHCYMLSVMSHRQ